METPAPAPQPEIPPPEAPPARLRILHVDDFDEFLDEFRELFAEHFDITSAQSGAEALERLADQDFDAAVVDYEMPDLDGLELMARAQERGLDLPIIFCTGQGSEEVARLAFTHGAADYFVKDFRSPINRERLVQAVQAAVRRRVARLVYEREHRILEGLIEYNPYSIQIWDRDGCCIRSNPGTLRFFHSAPPPHVPLMQDEQLLAQGYGPYFEQACRGETVFFPVNKYNPSKWSKALPDKDTYTSGVLFSLYDARGELENYVLMHEDVTARVLAEQAAAEAHEALQRTVEGLEVRVRERTADLEGANRSLQQQMEMRERLQQELMRKNQELEAFTYRVSHDLRNDLLALRRTLEHVTDASELLPQLQRHLQRHDRLIEYVERLLSLSRSGRTISSRMDLSAVALVGQVFERLRLPDVPAELRVAPDCPPIPGDPMSLEEVFANLVSNSFQYRDPAKETLVLEVTCQRAEGRARVVYADNGLGVAPEHLDQVFDASFTTDRANHFGLGLAFVRRIIEAHGGTVEVRSHGKGLGTQFIVDLPLPRKR